MAVAEYCRAAQRATRLEAIARFDALYRSRKAAQSALDFSDLEEFSVRLLEENDDARERVRRQFDHVLMDEFQDTNGLQSKLLDLLRLARSPSTRWATSIRRFTDSATPIRACSASIGRASRRVESGWPSGGRTGAAGRTF